ncbi:MAG: CBS domain-containing protein, partial [Deltaproteobacteria bacterium]|nr:CBS domain-containing protein [Deltaproteobacteria bacterium]
MSEKTNKKQKSVRAHSKYPHEEIITTHINADFDSLASMIAVKKLYPDATLVFSGSQEKNLRNFFLHSASYIFDFSKIKQIDLDRVKKLILVDTRQKRRIGKFAELLERDDVEIHIYDHHPDSEEDIHGDVEIIGKAGSTTAILTNIIREKNLEISPDEATILSLGIHEDTGSFTFSSTTPEDYQAAAWLSEQGADHNIISDMLTRELTSEQLWLLNDLTRSATTRTINGIEVVIAKVIRENYIGDFAVLVHKFMEMENLNVIFALAQMEDKIYMVARSRIEDVNVAKLALVFGGGGHPQAASATIRKKTLIQVEKSLHTLLMNRINPQRAARDMMTSPVIHIGPEQNVKEASTIMTRYNINVLLVIDDNGKLLGYITRQIMEKAVFFGLGHIHVREYMNIDFSTVDPDAALAEVQDLIIRNRLRILPVIADKEVVGVITRTDLMNILVGGPLIPDSLYESHHTPNPAKKKNIASMLKERLPRRIIGLFKEFGATADMLGYNVYLMGGLVRDVFLKRENLDVDIVIEGDGIKFAQEFAEHNDVRVRSHRKFGTAVLIFPDGFKVDVATARMEYYETPAAPPIVATSSLKMDLFRRDFTINTLAIKLNKRDYGTLIDYFGGQKDLKEKVIRVLHNLSFVEDPTRVLRAIRFERRFGFMIGKLTLALIKNAVSINCFEKLSGKRLFLELKFLLMEQRPIHGIERMNEFDLLQFISPEIQLTNSMRELLEGIRGVIAWFDLLYLDEPYESWKVYWYGITSALDSNALRRLEKRMQMEDLENRKMIAQRVEAHSVLDQLYRLRENNNFGIYTLLSQYDTEILLFMMAMANNEKIKRLISYYITKLRDTKVQLMGRDLKNMGFSPGPLYKNIFNSLLEARLSDQVGSREEEIKFVNE